MARPKKHNADYFPHDAHMRNDEKLKAVRRKFGHNGYSVWNMLLEKLCDSKDFILKYNDQNLELLAGDFDIEVEDLKLMIEYFFKIELLFTGDGYIYSKTMIMQFESLFRKRKRDRDELSLTETLFESIFGSESA